MSDDDRHVQDATQRATDPGAVSDVAAATSDKAADTALGSSRPGYTADPDGSDEHQRHAPGAGRSAVSEVGDDD